MTGLFRDEILAIGAVLFGGCLVGGIEIRGSAQVLLEARDGIFVASILFEAAGLVEDVGWILRVNEEIG
jgi:hypothetical protein